MDNVLDILRWQFGITTVYHFLFVPLTIGLTLLVAILETLWLVSQDPAAKQQWLRLAKFFGKLFLINFAIGVVTGIVQEFQFGMGWSNYSRFVGDIFGAPLAVEALLSFFLESTFLGLWIFGWDKLPRPLHAATMWIVHIGTLASSWFILAANAFMQHPVGYSYNPDTGRAELTDFWAVMFNKVQLATFPHVVLAAYMTAAVFVVGVCAWQYRRRRTRDAGDQAVYLRGLRFGSVVTVIAFLGVFVVGDSLGKVMTEVQPMKMAAAEALYETSDGNAPFSLLTIGTRDGLHQKWAVEIPGVLSFLGTGSFDGRVEGINDLRAKYQEEYGSDPGETYYTAGEYVPIIPVTYWTFRWMMGMGAWAFLGALVILFLTRKGRTPQSGLFALYAGTLPVFVLLANSMGWVFTEMGRQPWLVFGLMTTENGVSPSVSATEAWISVVALTGVYGILAVVEVGLLLTYAKKGAAPFEEPPDPARVSPPDADKPLAFAY